MEAKESPYYLGNKEVLPNIFTMEVDGVVYEQELTWDMSDDELYTAFVTALSTHIKRDVVLNAMKNFDDKENGSFLPLLLSKTVMKLRNNDAVITITYPRYSNLNSLIRGLLSMMTAITYTEKYIEQSVKDYAKSELGEDEDDIPEDCEELQEEEEKEQE